MLSEIQMKFLTVLIMTEMAVITVDLSSEGGNRNRSHTVFFLTNAVLGDLVSFYLFSH